MNIKAIILVGLVVFIVLQLSNRQPDPQPTQEIRVLNN